MNQERSAEKPKGLILKEARLARKISLEAVHEATKIPLDILKAMEEGYTVRTLSPFYLKGFQKMYAQHLGVDIKDVVDDFKKEELPQPIDGNVAKQEDTRTKLQDIIPRDQQRIILKSIGLILLFLLMIKVIGCVKDKIATMRQESRTTRSRRIKKPVPVTVSPQKEVKEVSPAKSEPKETVKTQTKSKTSEPKPEDVKPAPTTVVTPLPQEVVPTPEPKKVAAAEPVAATAKETKTAAVKQEKKKDVNLTVKVKKKSWLQVKVDGTVVFQANLNKDEAETWRADKTIEISGNNIGDIEFELNGRKDDLLSRSDRNARRILVTREGISVVK